jgi:predicted CXXCH cytochrome family protein
VVPPATHGEQCVAPTDVMRRDHMDLLDHQRDETVIDGVRSNPYSLVDCVNCHASHDDQGQAIRIDAEGQFCQACHAYAAVKIDCFTCHAALPEETVGARDVRYHRDERYILQAYANGN